MQLIRQIDIRTTGLADAIDEGAIDVADRVPAPLDSLVRRLGAVNAEAVRQYGRLTITAIDAATGVLTVAWTGVRDVADSAGSAARTAAGSVERNLEVVGGRAARATDAVERAGAGAARRVAKAADTAVASTMEQGGDRPSGPYESWTKDELYERAQELDIDGRSGMSKAQLVKALRSA